MVDATLAGLGFLLALVLLWIIAAFLWALYEEFLKEKFRK